MSPPSSASGTWRHWGKGAARVPPGWCTESPEACSWGPSSVYEEMQPGRLTKMVGSKAYDHFVELVQEAHRLLTKGVALPHPAVRSRGLEGATESA